MMLLSVEVGNRRVRVVLLEKTGDRVRLLREALRIIPAPEDPKAQSVKFLNEFVSDHKILTRKLHLTVSDPDIVTIKNTTLPQMQPGELASALGWHAKEEGLLNEACRLFNYEVIKEYTDEDMAKKSAVLYTVVNHKLLERYLSLLGRAGFDVVQVSALPFDYAKVLSSYGGESVTQAVLDVGYDHSTLTIYRQGKLIFIRTLGFSYAKAKTALNDPLFLGDRHLTPEAEAEIVKAFREYGFSPSGEWTGDREVRFPQFFALMRPLIEGLVREMRYSLTYFMSNMKEEKPAALFMTGYGIEIKGLDAYFSKEMGISTFHLTMPESVEVKLENAAANAITNNYFVGAVAGVFSGPGTVDFTPVDFKNLKLEAAQRRLLFFTSVIVAGILATSFFFAKLQSAILENQQRINQRALQAFGKVAEVSSAVFPRYYLIYSIDRATIPADKTLRFLANMMPADIVPSRFLLDSSGRRLELDVMVSRPPEEQDAAIQDLAQKFRQTTFFSSVMVHPVAVPGKAIYRIEGEFRDD